ncbi:hypothetical protein X943_002154 [Babesia divergens]|uniref:Uncharacterized protein n=1 Tax=Babesia divergens TaxID=32595 RepID=A0AAD9LE84_BABDI|nr:hypothetical protein X943_002154 [Babesia divergens]
MLMGPDDPVFQELRSNPRSPNLGNARYDVIGPFGQEPDPDIDVPRVNMSLPRRGNEFFPPGGGMYGGSNGCFGPII